MLVRLGAGLTDCVVLCKSRVEWAIAMLFLADFFSARFLNTADCDRGRPSVPCHRLAIRCDRERYEQSATAYRDELFGDS